MKKLLTILVMLLFSLPVFGITKANSLQSYEDSYIVTGFNKKNQTIINLSIKWGLWYPFDTIFITYDQKSKWDTYDRSSPFRETNYSPGLIWQKDNILKLDYLRIIGWNHKSNGLAGEDSRSVDRGGLQAQISYGDKYKIGFNERYYYYYAISNHNPKYDHWIGFFKSQIFFSIKSKYGYLDGFKLYAQGEWTKKSYWFESALITNLGIGKSGLKLIAYYRRGCGMFMLDYTKITEYFGIGIGL